MPKGPQGQKRPADVIGCAVAVAKIATGEIDESGYRQPNKVKGGKAGAQSRSDALTPEQRSEIGRIAAFSRWKREPEQ